jgi:hypothetical protein
MRWLGLALALALWLVAAAPLAAADDAELEAWRKSLDAAQAELTSAQQAAAAAAVAYQNMRRDRSIRGKEKAEIVAARSDTQKALVDAQARLAASREEARRAGAPPQWVLPDPSEEPADEF